MEPINIMPCLQKNTFKTGDCWLFLKITFLNPFEYPGAINKRIRISLS